MANVHSHRRAYLDWLRGLAVLIMIEAHVIDSWTGSPDRDTRAFGWSLVLGGYGAPLFLFLAGVSVSLAAAARLRATESSGGSPMQAVSRIARRGLQIFLLAFVFRLQAVILSWGSWRSLLKVDILNIMGPSITAAAGLWALPRTTRGRVAIFAIAAAAVSLLTPPIRAFTPLAALPDPIEGYLRPVPGLTNFVFFPWLAFVFAGAAVGALIDTAGTAASESRLNLSFAGVGLALIAIGYGGSLLPSIYAHSEFWTTSPAYFAMRIGLLTSAVAAAYLWQLRPWRHRWSPVGQLGRTSLFIYWIHVEMVYGLMSRSLHRSLTLGEAWLAFVAFSVAMVPISLLKDAVVSRVKGIRPTASRTVTVASPRG
jgi:uncharacterized membrane protein